MADAKSSAWSGWRDKELAIPGAGKGVPIPLELRGGFSSSFSFHPVRGGTRGRDAGPDLGSTSGRGALRVVLPARFDSVAIRRRRGHEGAGGMHRWKIRVLAPDDVPLLSSEPYKGHGFDTVAFLDGSRRSVDLHYEFEDEHSYGDILFNPESGREPQCLVRYDVQHRGTLRLPEPGYVTFETPDRWEVRVE
ncbi:hypothetical protein [Streptomyces sp. bgisy100]|uniref:hypothetical protein n=1 Tax=Streptomyces sp. bgisy100 TaxID=3413783 RepID=UPI003D7515EC